MDFLHTGQWVPKGSFEYLVNIASMWMYTDRVSEFIKKGALKHGKLLRNKWLVDPLTGKRRDASARLQAEKDSHRVGAQCDKELFNYYIAIDAMMGWYKKTLTCAHL